MGKWLKWAWPVALGAITVLSLAAGITVDVPEAWPKWLAWLGVLGNYLRSEVPAWLYYATCALLAVLAAQVWKAGSSWETLAVEKRCERLAAERREEQRRLQEERRREDQLTIIRNLPMAEVFILLKMLREPIYLAPDMQSAEALREVGLIRRLITVPDRLAGVNGGQRKMELWDVEPSARQTLERARPEIAKRTVLEIVKTGGTNASSALSFFSISPKFDLPWPQSRSDEMDQLYYAGFRFLVSNKLLVSRTLAAGQELFFINQAFLDAVEDVLESPPRRDHIVVDLNSVNARASGGGAS